MKKHIHAFMALSIAVLLAAGCGKKEPEQAPEPAQKTEENVVASGVGEDASDGISVETDAYSEDPDSLGGLPVIMGAYDINDCIEIEGLDELDLSGMPSGMPEYKDAELSVLLRSETTRLSDPDAWIEPGDLVNADVCAYIDGELSYNYSRMGENIRIGAQTEEKEIEDALMGMYVKEEKEFDKTYTEDDNYLGLGGQTVHYRIIPYAIYRPKRPDETEVMRELERMTAAAEAGSEKEQLDYVWGLVMARTNVKAYPEAFVRKARAEYEARELRSEPLEDYLNRVGMTRAQFKEYEDGYAQDKAAEKLAIALITERYGVSEDDPVRRRYASSDAYNPDDPDMPMRMAAANAVKERWTE